MLPNKKHDKSHTDIAIHSFKIFDLIVTNDGFTGYGYTTEDFKKAPDISYKKSNMGTVLHTCHPGQEQHSACLIHPLSVCQSNTTKLNNYNFSILILFSVKLKLLPINFTEMTKIQELYKLEIIL